MAEKAFESDIFPQCKSQKIALIGQRAKGEGQRSRGAEEQRSRGAEEKRRRGEEEKRRRGAEE